MSDSPGSSASEDLVPVLLASNRDHLGHYSENWVRRLLPLNPRMRKEFVECQTIIDHWYRIHVFNAHSDSAVELVSDDTFMISEENTLHSDSESIISSSSDEDERPLSPVNPLRHLPSFLVTLCIEFLVFTQCAVCGSDHNLWLNLEDGYVGCGRRDWVCYPSSSKGCSLKHYLNTQKDDPDLSKEVLVVKLGTITKDTVDVFDYRNDRDYWIGGSEEYGMHDALKQRVQQRLLYWGIDMSKMEKYDQSMEEIQIEWNQRGHTI